MMVDGDKARHLNMLQYKQIQIGKVFFDLHRPDSSTNESKGLE